MPGLDLIIIFVNVLDRCIYEMLLDFLLFSFLSSALVKRKIKLVCKKFKLKVAFDYTLTHIQRFFQSCVSIYNVLPVKTVMSFI